MTRSLLLFTAWGVVGFVAGFGLLYGFTPLGPGILAAIGLAFWWLPRPDDGRGAEFFGAIAGVGVFCLFIASAIDRDAAMPWLLAGLTLTPAASAIYLVAGRRRCHRERAPLPHS